MNSLTIDEYCKGVPYIRLGHDVENPTYSDKRYLKRYNQCTKCYTKVTEIKVAMGWMLDYASYKSILK